MTISTIKLNKQQLKWKNGGSPNKPRKYTEGTKIHFFTVLKRLPNYRLLVKCECGTIKTVSTSALTTRRPTQSCGCKRKELCKKKPRRTTEQIQKDIITERGSTNKQGRCPVCESVSDGLCKWCKDTYVYKKQKGYYAEKMLVV